MVKAIAIDDEQSSLSALSALVSKFSNQITLVKCFRSTKDVVEFLNVNSIDVIFLDIKLFSNNGIEWYQSLPNKIPVVFCTAFDTYAVKAFELHALDYLTKPIALNRFTSTLKRIESTLKDADQNQEIILKADLNWHKIKYSDILFIKALDDYIKIFIVNGKPLIIKSTLKDILTKLPAKQFLRVHRSYIISLRNVSNLDAFEVTILDHKIPISKSYKKYTLQQYKSVSYN